MSDDKAKPKAKTAIPGHHNTEHHETGSMIWHWKLSLHNTLRLKENLNNRKEKHSLLHIISLL